MTGVLGAFGVIFAIIMFVVAHEAGHFFAAKATGMKVTEFFLGFGPRIWSFRRGETEYGIKPIPFGAYVRIIGMSALEDVEPSDEGRTYRDKPFWAKSFVVLAGIAANFLLAFVLFFGLAMWVGERAPNTEVAGVVPEVSEGVPTAAAGADIREGDVIVELDGAPIAGWQQLSAELAARPDQTVTLGVLRDGAVVPVAVELGSRTDPESGETVGFLGIAPGTDRLPIGVFGAIGAAGTQVWSQVLGTFDILTRIFSFDAIGELAGGIAGNEVSDEIRPVSVIGLAQIGAQADSLGIGNLVFLLAAVNVVLGTINALPLFPLDGGHFAVALFEKLTKRRVDIRALVPVAVLVIGALSLLGIMTIILDIVNPVRLPS